MRRMTRRPPASVRSVCVGRGRGPRLRVAGSPLDRAPLEEILGEHSRLARLCVAGHLERLGDQGSVQAGLHPAGNGHWHVDVARCGVVRIRGNQVVGGDLAPHHVPDRSGRRHSPGTVPRPPAPTVARALPERSVRPPAPFRFASCSTSVSALSGRRERSGSPRTGSAVYSIIAQARPFAETFWPYARALA